MTVEIEKGNNKVTGKKWLFEEIARGEVRVKGPRRVKTKEVGKEDFAWK